MAVATLANGCFWCTEAVFKRLKGVLKVESGYAGGNMENPSYEDVTSGQTGHVEALQITYDPEIISFNKLLDVFWATHDPTSLDKQGADQGPMYRSVIFYHSGEQKEVAEKSKKTHQAKYKDLIVTEIIPFKNFYPAEGYHKDYYDKNRSAPYCQLVIDPKIKKLYQEFKEEAKD